MNSTHGPGWAWPGWGRGGGSPQARSAVRLWVGEEVRQEGTVGLAQNGSRVARSRGAGQFRISSPTHAGEGGGGDHSLSAAPAYHSGGQPSPVLGRASLGACELPPLHSRQVGQGRQRHH